MMKAVKEVEIKCNTKLDVTTANKIKQLKNI